MSHREASAVLFAATVAVLPDVGLGQADPVAVFRQAIDARNRGDIVTMMALFTDDVVREDGTPTFTRQEAIAAIEGPSLWGRSMGGPAIKLGRECSRKRHCQCGPESQYTLSQNPRYVSYRGNARPDRLDRQ
jgi:hypothetical protein